MSDTKIQVEDIKRLMAELNNGTDINVEEWLGESGIERDALQHIVDSIGVSFISRLAGMVSAQNADLGFDDMSAEDLAGVDVMQMLVKAAIASGIFFGWKMKEEYGGGGAEL